MNLSLLPVVLFGVGGILIYSAVKGYDPRDVVRNSLTGKSPGASGIKYTLGGSVSTQPFMTAPTGPSVQNARTRATGV